MRSGGRGEALPAVNRTGQAASRHPAAHRLRTRRGAPLRGLANRPTRPSLPSACDPRSAHNPRRGPPVRIEGIAATFPSRVVSNDDILEMNATESRESFRDDLKGSKIL